jgi:glutamine---fructose-6-phosphate transaminase (isomerizing)
VAQQAATARPEWHGEGWPEFRDGPPWVTAEMVAAQPDLVVPILADPAARAIARLIGDAVARDEPVVVTGCGTSEHGAQAVARLLDDGLRLTGRRGGLVEARQALDAALDPRPGGLLVAVSHDGGTRATLLAAEAAKAAGARLALVTGRAEGPIAAVADAVLVGPLRDRSWCHTVAYASAILAGGAVGAAVAGAPLDGVALAAFLRGAVSEDGQAESVAGAVWGSDRLLACGLGTDDVTARELALKVEEGPRLPATARHLETLLHGHFVACDGGTGLVLLAIDSVGGDRRNARLALASRAAQRLGMRPAALFAAGAAGAIPPDATPGGRLVLPPAPSCPLPALPALLGGAAALQRLTLALVSRAGVNPDLIRREEAPYREAAAVAEDSPDW